MPRTAAQKRREGLTRSPKRANQKELHREGRSGKGKLSRAYQIWREPMVEAQAQRVQAELAAMETQHPKE